MRTNWIEGPNPFGLATPPRFFLRDLATFDADLVIFPSAEQACYRLCRRVTRGAPLTKVARMQTALGVHVERFDHKVVVKERLVPVISLHAFPHWGPKILLDLAEADLWRHGGAEKADEMINAREQDERRRLDQHMSDELDARGHAAWSAYKWGSGQIIDPYGRPAQQPLTPHPYADVPLQVPAESGIVSASL